MEIIAEIYTQSERDWLVDNCDKVRAMMVLVANHEEKPRWLTPCYGCGKTHMSPDNCPKPEQPDELAIQAAAGSLLHSLKAGHYLLDPSFKGSKPHIYNAARDCVHAAFEFPQPKREISSWQPIETYNSNDAEKYRQDESPVEFWASHIYGMHRCIGYKHGNEFYALNHNEDEEGSELIHWQPTHWRRLAETPEGMALCPK